MMEVGTIVIIVTTVLTFLLNIHQSVKSRHFECNSGCSSCMYESEHKDNSTNISSNTVTNRTPRASNP